MHLRVSPLSPTRRIPPKPPSLLAFPSSPLRKSPTRRHTGEGSAGCSPHQNTEDGRERRLSRRRRRKREDGTVRTSSRGFGAGVTEGTRRSTMSEHPPPPASDPGRLRSARRGRRRGWHYPRTPAGAVPGFAPPMSGSGRRAGGQPRPRFRSRRAPDTGGSRHTRQGERANLTRPDVMAGDLAPFVAESEHTDRPGTDDRRRRAGVRTSEVVGRRLENGRRPHDLGLDVRFDGKRPHSSTISTARHREATEMDTCSRSPHRLLKEASNAHPPRAHSPR